MAFKKTKLQLEAELKKAGRQITSLEKKLENVLVAGREQMDDVLHDSQVQMASIINSATDAIISIDNSHSIVLFNPAAEKMFGYRADEVMGQSLDKLIPELYRAKHRQQIANFKETGITNRHMNGYMEIAGIRKNGDEIPIDASISQIDIKGGKLFTAILRDVTESKQTKETQEKIHNELELQFKLRTKALSDATALLETMLEYVPDQIYFKDAESRFIRNSRSQARALGLSDPAEVIGKTDFDFFPHAQRSYDEEQEIVRSGKPLVDFEERVVWPGGKETWVSTSKVPLRNKEGQIIGTFGISRDITDRKRAEEFLRKAKSELEIKVAERTAELIEANMQLQLELSERKRTEEALMHSQARVTGIINSAMDAIISIDNSQHIVLFNPAAEVMFGCDQAFALGQPIENFMPERFRSSHSQHIQHFSDTGVTSRAMGKLGTIYGLHINGKEFPIEASISQVGVAGEKVMTVILRDITQREHAEQELRFYASIVELATDAIIGKTLDGTILSWNIGAEKLYGYPADEMIGKSIIIIMPPEKPDELPTILERIRKGEHIEHYETVRVARDGRRIDVSLTVSPIQDDTGKVLGASAISRDITARKQAEEALLASEARYHNTLDAMLEGCQIIGFDWRYLYLNDVADKHNRMPKEELLGNKYMDMWPGIESTGVFAVIKRCMEEREPQSMENNFTFPDGGQGWFELRIYPVPEGIVILSIDITERKQAEDRQRFLAAASKALGASLDYETTLTTVAQLAVPKIADWCTIYLVAADGTIEQVALTHAKPEKIKWAQELQKRFPSNPNAPRGVAQVIRSGKAEFMPEIPSELLEPLKKDPEMSKLLGELEITGSMTVPFIAHEQILGAISLVSAESRMHYTSVDLELAEELALRVALTLENVRLYLNAQQQNEKLEERVALRTLELDATNKELEAFAYSVSHDLRSPLRGIDGWSLALLEDYGPLLDEQGQAHIQRVRAEAQRMGGIIDDILKLSRITRAEMNKEKVGLSIIAQNVVARLQETKPQDRRVEFIIQQELACMGDPKLLEVVLTNLLGNAFKFTSKKAEARIEFGQTIVEGEPVFFVRDNGAGFDMTYANKLFRAFQRMHRASEFPGTGVGLATVQRIINRHGGKIWASSEVEQGTTFHFTLGDTP